MLEISKRAATCPITPLPVRASVTIARAKPIIAARPLSCSEKAVKPCGIFCGFSSMLIETVAARRGGAALMGRRQVKEETDGETVGRERMGVAETNAEFIVE